MMRICAAVFDIQIPSASSLKDKRKQIKGLIDSFRANFNVAVSEVAYHDKWQRAAIGVVWISQTTHGEDSYLSSMRDLITAKRDVELLGIERAEY